jgi:hypothetical protein
MLPHKRQRNLQLLPGLSAREHLSRMLTAAVADWDLPRLPALLAKFHHDKEIVKDLIWDHYLAAYENFMRHKVAGRKYNRAYSFFLNTLSSVMSTWPHVRNRYWRLDEERFRSTSIDKPVDDAVYGDFLGVHEPLLYLSPGKGYSRKPSSEHKAWARANRLRDAYPDYLMECEELGVTPVSFERYVEVNRGDDYEGAFVELALKCGSFAELTRRRGNIERRLRRAQLDAEREGRDIPDYLSLLDKEDTL